MSKIYNRGLYIGGDKRSVAGTVMTITDENPNGITRCFGATVPTDGDNGFAPGCLFWKSTGGSTGSTLYVNEGSLSTADFNAVAGGGGAIGNFSLDDAYNDGKTISVDGAAVTLTGTHATNNTLVVTATGGSGNTIDITNAGSGYDIIGTSDTWYVSSAGAALLTGITGCDTIVAAANLALDATGAGTITLGATSTGAITLTRATTIGAALTVTGGADADALIITAGDILVSDGHMTMVQPDNESSIEITAAGSSSANVISIVADGLTSGAAIYVDSDNGASFSGQGGYLHFYNGTSTDLFVGRYGALTITGNAAGTDSIMLTAGDLTMTSGNIVMTAGDLTMTAGNFVNTLGDMTLTAGNFVMTLGDASLVDGSLTVTDADNAATIDVTNNTITTADLMVVDSTSITTGALVKLNANAATADGEVLEIISAGDATSTPTGLSITIASVTTGAAKGAVITMAGATTTAVGLTVDMAALTTGSGALITTAGVVVTTGNLLTLTANSATTAAGLLRINANGLTSGIGAVIASSSTGLTGAGRLLRVDHTGNAGNASGVVAEIASAAADETVVMRVTASAALALGVALDISAAALTTGTALDIGGMAAITTGNGIVIAASGTTRTDGMLISATCASTAATATGRMLLLNHTGATSASGASIIAEMKSAAADGTVVLQVKNSAAMTGSLAVFDMSASVTGTGIQIKATQATLTSGFYLACYNGAANDFTIGDYGATTIKGSAVGTAALTITAGDLVLTDGTILGKEKTETVSATNAIGVAESGTTYFLSDATEFVSTLPAPAAGLHYKFIVAAAPDGASYTIVTTSGTDLIHGVVNSAEDAAGSVDGTIGTPADTITFVLAKSLVGDWVEVVSDGTYWYARGGCAVQDAITFTQT